MPGEIKKFLVTLLVMRHFFIWRGTPRACVDFCDPTAVSRFQGPNHTIWKWTCLLEGHFLLPKPSRVAEEGLDALKMKGVTGKSDREKGTTGVALRNHGREVVRPINRF